MKNPYDIIIRPHITEKTVALSYGNPNVAAEKVQRKYTFVVASSANKIEIKSAIEAIYNVTKSKKDKAIEVDTVRTVSMKGKRRRVGMKSQGKRPDWKKAIITLKAGQVLEDFGV